MDAGEIVAAVATFLAVAVALGMGVKSLRQTRDIQRRQYQLGQLDEVIAWAQDIAKCEAESDIRTMPRDEKVGLFDLVFRYQAINARRRYVDTITSEFGGNVQVDTAKVGAALADHIDFLRRLLEGDTTKEKVKEHWSSLVEDALSLVEHATKDRSGVADLQHPSPIRTRLRRLISRIMNRLKRKH